MSDATLKPMEQPAAEEQKQRERSQIRFPYGDLNDAIAVAGAVHQLGGKCGADQLAPELGHDNVDSGAYGAKVATARIFTLITTSKDGITLTPLGHRMVDPLQVDRARVDAFLAVPLYKALYEKVKGYTLPPTSLGLEAVLVELGVAEKQKDKARQALQRSADHAGFFYQGRDRLVLPAVANRPSEGHVETGQGDQRGQDDRPGGSGSGPSYPTLIKGMLEKLPKEGSSWSKEDRDQWIKAIELILDMVYTVTAEAPKLLAAPQNGDVA